jgi:hypothetical protein
MSPVIRVRGTIVASRRAGRRRYDHATAMGDDALDLRASESQGERSRTGPIATAMAIEQAFTRKKTLWEKLALEARSASLTKRGYLF